jgi:cell wall-associated NlpC family hydrolase
MASSGNLPITILILGGGLAMVWVGIANPEGGITAEIGRVLRGEPGTKLGHTQTTAADLAAAVLTADTGTTTAPGAMATSATGAGGGIVAAAMSQRGVKYVWGGGGKNGPTSGGFDCSGLTQYAAYKGAGVSIPRVAEAQRAALPQVPASQAAPGDLVFFGAPAYHCGVYLGGGQMVHAPHTGTVVKTEAVADVTPGPVRYGRVTAKSGSGLIAA